MKKAIQYYVKACELNEMFGCLSLVSNSQINKQKLFQYLSKACGLNDQDGCLILGYKQYAGKGIVKNEKQAVKTFEKACRLGSEDACGILNNY
ncbi:hypothetical protein ACQJ93_01080 [Helicobacter pylori]